LALRPAMVQLCFELDPRLESVRKFPPLALEMFDSSFISRATTKSPWHFHISSAPPASGQRPTSNYLAHGYAEGERLLAIRSQSCSLEILRSEVVATQAARCASAGAHRCAARHTGHTASPQREGACDIRLRAAILRMRITRGSSRGKVTLRWPTHLAPRAPRRRQGPVAG
jgi:hypothetical protein